MQIHAISEPALTSAILQLDVLEDEGAVVIAVEPTSIPSTTVEPSETISPTITATNDAAGNQSGNGPGFMEWLLAAFTVTAGALVAYYTGMKIYSIRWGIRWGLCTILAGLVCYLYIVLDLPGGKAWFELTRTSGLLFAILLFMGLGWVAGFLWHAFSVRQTTGALR
jgi:hypothetical protein